MNRSAEDHLPAQGFSPVRQDTPASAPCCSALRTLAAVAAEIGAGQAGRDAADLDERTAQGRFFVACIGQFKRGKSTLLNALVGRPILPTGVVPVTTVVTILRFGQALDAHVRLTDGRLVAIDPEALAEFVSEASNPENCKGVAVVEVTVPSPLLASGMCLVDTPGLGSVFAASSETTRAFVPQIDAALVVLGTDPPISGEELELLEQVMEPADQLTRDRFVVEPGFREDAHFFFTSLLTVAAPGFWAWILDWIRPRPVLLRSSIRQASKCLGRLMTTNSARMANDLTARVEESQRRLAVEIRAGLSSLVEGAEHALERARVRQASGAEAVTTALARLDHLRKRVEAAPSWYTFARTRPTSDTNGHWTDRPGPVDGVAARVD
jgi:hypothetical protein